MLPFCSESKQGTLSRNGKWNCTNSLESTVKKRIFIAALDTIVMTWEQSKCPSTEEWTKKMWYTHTREYYSAIKNIICSNMHGPRDYHKDKY